MIGGALPSPEDRRDFRLSRCMDMPTGGAVLPRSYRVSWLPEIKDQGHVNSCTAFALSYIFECIRHKQTKGASRFSTGFLYGNRRETWYKDAGQIMRDAVKGAHKYGDVPASVWDNNLEVPEAINAFESAYNAVSAAARKLIKGYVRIYDADEARAFLCRYDVPLFVNTTMRKVNPMIRSDGYHALILTEYTWDKFYICRNSWGDKNCPSPKLRFDDFVEIWGIIPMEEIKFTDVNEERWSAGAIKTAANDGIVAGYPDGSFAPEKSLTREEMAVIWERMKAYIAEHYEKNP